MDLEQLLNGMTLSRAEAREQLLSITSGACPPAKVAALLTILRMRSITVDELHGFRDGMLERAVPVSLEGRQAIDLCGTGGDGKHTFNISTTAAFVVAGAGYPVLKHGNYAVSSRCGSSNLIEALKLPVPKIQSEIHRCLDTAQFAYLHAPFFHPAMSSVAPIRRELAVRTVFNLLGPLCNPAQPAQLTGVYSPAVATLYHQLLARDQRPYGIVYTDDGFDEVSLTGECTLIQRSETQKLPPESFGLSKITPDELLGGSGVDESLGICFKILHNTGTPAQRDVVIANASLAIKVLRPDFSLTECVEIARVSLLSGAALGIVRRLQEMM